jgi:hypothetical protein
LLDAWITKTIQQLKCNKMSDYISEIKEYQNNWLLNVAYGMKTNSAKASNGMLLIVAESSSRVPKQLAT